MAGTAEGSTVVAALQLLAGAAFLGAVMDGLLLGHWYLTDRGLTRTPINRTTNLLLVGVVLEAVALILGGFGPTPASSQFNPLLTSAGLASWIALGMVATTALIAVMIRLTLRGARVLRRPGGDRLLLSRRDHGDDRGVRGQGPLPPLSRWMPR